MDVTLDRFMFWNPWVIWSGTLSGPILCLQEQSC
jgi:hypothetical protein